jgi:thiol-disulfide isomerase/thioredoxin
MRITLRLLQGLCLIGLALVAHAASDHPILQPGSKAPDYTLPGVDGKTHSLADYASGPVQGRMDDNYRIERVKNQDARAAIEAVLAGCDVGAAHSGVFGCSTKWKEKEADRIEAQRKLDARPVKLDLVSADGLKQLRANAGGRLTLVTFWATWCGSCLHEFGDIETTYRMYSNRDLDLVTVAANLPEERDGVLRVLTKNHSTGRNLLFHSDKTTELQTAFDPEWDSAVPYTALLGPGGKLLCRMLGAVDILELRRVILKNLPAEYAGFSSYWEPQH